MMVRIPHRWLTGESLQQSFLASALRFFLSIVLKLRIVEGWKMLFILLEDLFLPIRFPLNFLVLCVFGEK